VPDAVSKLTKTFEYNDIISLQNQFHKFPGQVAGVIMEPMGIVEPKLDYLQQVKKLTSDNGALLIFDEVLTGFRLAMGGAQEYFNVQPDLSCFAKAMANGYPISAIVGSRKFMSLFEEIFFSGTFGGETLSLAATKATINKMQSSNVIDHLWRQGRKLQVGYDSLAKDFGLSENTKCIGLAPHTVCTFTDDNGNESLLMRSVVQQELVKRGVLFLVGFNICYALTDEDVEITLDAVAEALKVLSEAKDNDRLEIVLEGPPVQAVFRRA
jgi:glutamate-1-semialdehyde 2,1-aminomutase/spore coat polysaccharide biosynthesis protein SpsF